MAKRGPSDAEVVPADRYQVRCPDRLEVTVEGRPDLSGPREIGLDGRIDLGRLGRLRVEGESPPEIARDVAELTEVPAGRVHVCVREYRSQQIYLLGEGNGLQRSVAYQGPETVHELLRRVGGITPGAAPRNVSVLRAHIADGRAPEVFRVNLEDIVLHHDERTDLRLQPFDQIFVGETRKSSLEKCVPPCLRPLYKAICGLYGPSDEGKGPAPEK
jgi:protein involved in polysaccharide export with SLBB domain